MTQSTTEGGDEPWPTRTTSAKPTAAVAVCVTLGALSWLGAVAITVIAQVADLDVPGLVALLSALGLLAAVIAVGVICFREIREGQREMHRLVAELSGRFDNYDQAVCDVLTTSTGTTVRELPRQRL